MEEFKEIVNITEHPNGEAVIVLDEEFFNKKSRKDRQKIVDSLCVLGRDKLMSDVFEADNISQVKISKDPVHKNSVIVLRFLINNDGDFRMLTYFGEKIPQGTSIRNGLIHAAEVVSIIQKNNKS